MPRYREFDTEEAMACIKSVFWEHGFEGTSMALIEAATGLKKQSLYRAFGSKREMYLAVLHDYDRVEVTLAIQMLQQSGQPQKRIDNLLSTIINNALDSGDRRGCLLCNASVDQAPLDGPSSDAVEKILLRFKRAIEQCLMDAPSFATDVLRLEECACALLAGYFGIRVMIKAGLDRYMLDGARKRLILMLQ
ncbi:MAG: helix-turn-helix domain-containing protein [Paraperlucidibaca sp.]